MTRSAILLLDFIISTLSIQNKIQQEIRLALGQRSDFVP